MRLNTKADRLKVREYEFNRLIERGYKKETYKDLVIFTNENDGKFLLNVFIGTSTKDENHYYYRTDERRTEVINNFKSSADRREQRKNDAKGNKKLSPHAACAKAIREELKNEFPGVSFSVTSEIFSGGDSVRISWNDGPTYDEVNKITGKYKEGHFDGMQDMYIHSDNGLGVGAKYVSCSRSMSEDKKSELLQYFRENYSGCENANYNDYLERHGSYLSQMIYRHFAETSYYKKPDKPEPPKPKKNEVSEEIEYLDFAAELLGTSEEKEQTENTNEYEEKQAAKAERYRELAEKARSKSSQAFSEAQKIGSFIPMGQPILVGHHSEGRHRRDLARIDNNMRKSIELDEKAKYYEQKAENSENSNVISSDDPQAIEKLCKKLESLQNNQELMKAVNKIIKKNLQEVEKVEQIQALGLTEKQALEIMKPDFMGRVGFASYALSNNNQNINSVKKRIEYLKKLGSQDSKTFLINGVKVVDDTKANRLKIFFDSIPTEETRTELKRNGFRWSPSNKCWQSYRGQYQTDRAKRILTA